MNAAQLAALPCAYLVAELEGIARNIERGELSYCPPEVLREVIRRLRPSPPPQNPYTDGVAAANWRRGFNGECLVADPGSVAAKCYREGLAARQREGGA